MKWKCKQSGNVIDLPDVEEENMLGHDGYEKVEEPIVQKPPKAVKPLAEDTKK